MAGITAEPRWYYDIGDDEAAALLARLEDRKPDDGLLLRGAAVVSLDPRVGDLCPGDVLVRGRTIEQVGPDLSATAADGRVVVVDMRGMIVMPGLVESHRHCWQNQLRRLLPDADIQEYLATTHAGSALHYRPQDIYAGVMASILGLIDGGVTCVLDYCHNSRSRQHSDAAFRAYLDTGIRAVHVTAAPNAGDWEQQWPHDAVRLRDTYCSDAGSLLSVRLGMDQFMTTLTFSELFELARDNGIAITLDGMIGGPASAEIEQLGAAGLLGPDVTIIHAMALSDTAWRRMAEAGVAVTLATTCDQMLGLADGLPAVQKALDHGIRPSLSADVEITLAGDMFTQMRGTLATQRMHATKRRYHGDKDAPAFLTSRDLLEFATVDGARAIGLADRIGTLTPGKEADLIAIRAEDANNMPLNNAVGTIVQGTDSKNVDTVLVAGTVRKWRGELVGFDIAGIRRLVHESRDFLAAAAGLSVDPVQPRGGHAVPPAELTERLAATSRDRPVPEAMIRPAHRSR
jgi:cytosine/adenosine deaminase-related metal-dependent hydrolase